ncbi:spore germination protein [Ammoniphilus sp. YIM 78166]|uniref:spore germination protein n=1 Tax=Ammoniphilus sp. YIM 78166 TaxID=1644106 RepID=UPI001F0D7F34|nr:spore germination protein [Ammoniphilus sp. YIM 78166]
MTHINNIFNVRVNNVSNNASINFGNVIHKGHQANVKANIGQALMGDAFYSPANNFNKNIHIDPDLIDQPQAQV